MFGDIFRKKNLNYNVFIYIFLYSFPIAIELLNLLFHYIFENYEVFSPKFDFQNSMFFNSYLIKFYRRSLLGTIIDLMNLNISVKNIFIIKSIFNIIFIHQFYRIFVKEFKIISFFSIIFITPFLLNIVYRLSSISDLLVIVCFLLSVRTYLNRKYLLSILFILFGILTHELYLFIFLPLNIYMFSKTKYLFFLTIVVLISVSFILTSNHDNYSLYLLEKRFQSYGFSANENWDRFFKSNILENVLYSIDRYIEVGKNSGFRTRLIFHIPLLFVYTFLYLYFLKFFRIKKEMNFYKIIIVINVLLLVFLSLLGHDINRWFTLFLFNSLLLKLLFNNDLSESDIRNFMKFNIITIFLGPLGDTSTFPYLISVIKKISILI